MSSFPDEVRRFVEGERIGAVATVVAGPSTGAKALIDVEEGLIAGSLPDGVGEGVLADVAQLADREQSRTLEYGDHRIFIEALVPQPRLLVFGAGHIAQPLSRMAAELGYRVTVADARAAFATPERFPDVDELIVGWPDAVFEKVELDRRTYVVLLSHDSRFEDPVFPAIRKSAIRYMGALGSRRTAADRRRRLAEAGWSQEELDRIHAPIGIDIAAEQPAEVAVSILAEMTMARYGAGTGLSLVGQEGRMHPQRGDE